MLKLLIRLLAFFFFSSSSCFLFFFFLVHLTAVVPPHIWGVLIASLLPNSWGSNTSVLKNLEKSLEALTDGLNFFQLALRSFDPGRVLLRRI